MYTYNIYGFGIHSEFELACLSQTDIGADIVIRAGEILLPELTKCSTGVGLSVYWDKIYIQMVGIGDFYIRHGYEVTVSVASPDVKPVVQRLLTGIVLGVVMHQRGRLNLHASVVALGDGAVAFVGESGWGKSTLAAALHARGYPLVADDIASIDVGTDTHLVYPGMREFKLLPDALDMLGGDAQQLPRVFPEMEKRASRVNEGFHDSPLPLRCIYILDYGEEHAIVPLRPALGVLEMIGHSYGWWLLQSVEKDRHFRNCSTVARTIPISRLQRKESLDYFPELLDLLEADMTVSELAGAAV